MYYIYTKIGSKKLNKKLTATLAKNNIKIGYTFKTWV